MIHKISLATLIIISLSGCSLLRYDLVDPYEDLTYKGLQALYIHPKPVSKDYYTPVTVIFRGETYEAEGKIRGGSTALYPKKSFTLKFPDEKLLPDPFADSSDPDYMERRKIVLIANFDDNSHMRNRLAYWFWNQLDNNYKIKSNGAAVFANGKYEGLYTMAEFINDSFIERNNLNGNGITSGGDLFKGTTNEVKYILKDDLLSGFEKKGGYPEEGDEGAFKTLEEFITKINTYSESEVSTYFANDVDFQSFYDWWFMISFLQAWDSGGKNSYVYLPTENGRKWQYIPWDFNESFGQSWNTSRKEPFFNRDNTSSNGIFERLIKHPDFEPAFNSRYGNDILGSADPLDLTNILNEVDSIYNEIRDAALEDEKKWNSTFRDFHLWDDRDDFTTFDEEVQYIKDWITAQHALFMAEY